ncbi:hypothetical protein MMC24_003933 [Lignoscripta atroalba]|nr:hypothetical protein [Lignoscripta atroalba]
MSKAKVTEGVFAINKPKSITSAQVIRDLQEAFKPSKLFAPWLAAEKASRESVSANQKKRRRDKRLNVKIGHGGTLDPLATGVLIVGVGKGTKQLQSFLECTKAYEATLLFGAATDTYDVLGKVLRKASYSQVTRQKVEEALDHFRGHIMQRPPIFSALSIQGKRLYEYAREGKEVPVEIQARPVLVEALEITEWLEPGSHEYVWPLQQAESEEQQIAEKILHLDEVAIKSKDATARCRTYQSSNVDNGIKRKRVNEDNDEDGLVSDRRLASKRQQVDEEHLMSGGLQPSEPGEAEQLDASSHILATHAVTSAGSSPLEKGPPAVKLRMIVTSGFYVRSLCHDLGKAVGSLGVMSGLVRTRQGGFELGKNVLDYEDLSKGEDVWGPKVERMLDGWKSQAEGERVERPSSVQM